jgi:hypothetical protein
MAYQILRTWNNEQGRAHRLLYNADFGAFQPLVFQKATFDRMVQPDWTDLKIVDTGADEVSWILGALGELPQNQPQFSEAK